MPLHDVARRLGFSWKSDRYNCDELFRERLFDNHRAVKRSNDGSIEPFPHGSTSEGEVPQFIEFTHSNSQIPLEYAYAAWDRLPEGDEHNRILSHLRRFLRSILSTLPCSVFLPWLILKGHSSSRPITLKKNQLHCQPLISKMLHRIWQNH